MWLLQLRSSNFNELICFLLSHEVRINKEEEKVEEKVLQINKEEEKVKQNVFQVKGEANEQVLQ